MKKHFKIGIYGDSLVMPRPGFVNKNDRYFTQLCNYFKEKDYDLEVFEKARASIPIAEVRQWVLNDNVYYEDRGDVLIIHLGIVDCAPRPVSLKTRNRISKLPEFIRKHIISYIHNNRAKLLTNGGHRVTPLNSFNAIYNKIVEIGLQQYNKIFLINICPTLPETELHSPGLSASINMYNSVIYEIMDKYKDEKSLKLIDINSILLQQSDLKIYFTRRASYFPIYASVNF